MRKFAFLLLLAGTAVPSVANAEMQRSPRGDDDNPRAERSVRAERPQRAERAQRPQRAERIERNGSTQGGQRNLETRRERSQAQTQTSRERSNGVFGRQMREQIEARQQAERPTAPARERRNLGGRSRDGDIRNQTWQPRERQVRTIPNTTITPTVTRDGTRRYDRDRNGTTSRHWDGRRWGRDWRGDNRYDWRRHRDRNRTVFRLGFYYDPFGWSYRRYNIGSQLYPNYYRSNYWINDPWQYRLPPVYGPYRWVRYHNDALLVDTWSGQVVDVIYGFFW